MILARGWRVVVWCVVWAAVGRAADFANFFEMTHVWTARFAFTQDQWKGLAPVPKQGRGYAAGRPLSRFEAQVGLRNGITGNSGLSLEYVHGDLTIDGVRFANAGIRYKGNGTLRRGIRWARFR